MQVFLVSVHPPRHNLGAEHECQVYGRCNLKWLLLLVLLQTMLVNPSGHYHNHHVDIGDGNFDNV